MQRRNVLRSAALVTAVSVGLAGCSGSDADESDQSDDEDGTESGGEAICQAPEDPLEESFPNSERFEQEQIFTGLADYFDE